MGIPCENGAISPAPAIRHADLAAVVEMTQIHRRAVAAGDRPGPAELATPDPTLTLDRFAVESANHLRAASRSSSATQLT
ncbi:hypothetical protein BJ958_004838 [Nocardioides kongjuensis]|uniref:Uncharacterized protein n=1 Tax=Nocardioides kongjuensis TaxID=349522 RepID=A0A852S3E2_9ACTN|nr:hypothetical protein [Nocardioides kongjuensis]